MNGNEYQNLCWQTAKPFYQADVNDTTFKQLQFTTAVTALAGEAGELCNKVKKLIESGELFDTKNVEVLADELGDIQWYVAHVARMFRVFQSNGNGIKLEDVMSMNISKLRERYKNNLTHRTI